MMSGGLQVILQAPVGNGLSFDPLSQEVIFQQDAVLERLVPTLDLALRH